MSAANESETQDVGFAEVIRAAESAAQEVSSAVRGLNLDQISDIAEVMADGFVYMRPEWRHERAGYQRAFWLALAWMQCERSTESLHFRALCGCNLEYQRAITGLRLAAPAVCGEHGLTRVVAY